VAKDLPSMRARSRPTRIGRRDRRRQLPAEAAGQAIDEYLAVLDDTAFREATEVTPKFVSPSDRRRTGQGRTAAKPTSYSTNYLVNVENATIVDVEATPARTYDEVASTKAMIERTEQQLDLKPD
jgi:hypothetical protein